MKKSNIMLFPLLFAFVSSSIAETYTVLVEMDSLLGDTPLTATQTQAISYPVLKVDQATKQGAACIANGQQNNTGFDNGASNNVNSLCPGGVGTLASMQFVGTPNALISYERSIELQVQNGVRFAHWDGLAFSDSRVAVLSANDGTFSTGLASSITLIDKTQVTDGIMEFSYDISAAYQ